METKDLTAQCVTIVGCDCGRISNPCNTLFFIAGFNRNTKTEREQHPDEGQWYRDGVPIDFDYVEEHVVASGASPEELLASVKEYIRLNSMKMEDYLAELGAKKQGIKHETR